MTARRGQRGFSQFEFFICVAVLAAIMAAFLARASFYGGEAERSVVQYTVATLRAALPLRMETLHKERGSRAAEAVVDENPFDWLSIQPDNYLGEYYSPDLEKMPRGNWLFDRRDKLLIYLPRSDKSFAGEASKFLMFKVKSTQQPTINGGQQARLRDGVVLEQVSGEP